MGYQRGGKRKMRKWKWKSRRRDRRRKGGRDDDDYPLIYKCDCEFFDRNITPVSSESTELWVQKASLQLEPEVGGFSCISSWGHFPIHGIHCRIIWSGSRPFASLCLSPACHWTSQAKGRQCMEWLKWEELPRTWDWDVASLVSSFWEIVVDETCDYDPGEKKKIRNGVRGTCGSCHLSPVSPPIPGQCCLS